MYSKTIKVVELALQQQKVYTLQFHRALFEEINKPIPHVNWQYTNKRIEAKEENYILLLNIKLYKNDKYMQHLCKIKFIETHESSN